MSEDLIKRSDAIDAVIEWYGCKPNDIEAFEKIIKAIPSADRPQEKSILQDTIQRLERVIKHGAVDKDGMHPVSAEVMLNWLKGADDETD